MTIQPTYFWDFLFDKDEDFTENNRELNDNWYNRDDSRQKKSNSNDTTNYFSNPFGGSGQENGDQDDGYDPQYDIPGSGTYYEQQNPDYLPQGQEHPKKIRQLTQQDLKRYNQNSDPG